MKALLQQMFLEHCWNVIHYFMEHFSEPVEYLNEYSNIVFCQLLGISYIFQILISFIQGNFSYPIKSKHIV